MQSQPDPNLESTALIIKHLEEIVKGLSVLHYRISHLEDLLVL